MESLKSTTVHDFLNQVFDIVHAEAKEKGWLQDDKLDTDSFYRLCAHYYKKASHMLQITQEEFIGRMKLRCWMDAFYFDDASAWERKLFDDCMQYEKDRLSFRQATTKPFGLDCAKCGTNLFALPSDEQEWLTITFPTNDESIIPKVQIGFCKECSTKVTFKVWRLFFRDIGGSSNGSNN